jgi:hypothetical protein
MAKYIVKPGERVTHGSYADAADHREKMGKLMPGQSVAVWPASPARDYFEGDELELTDDEAAAMPHAICTPEEFADMASPTAFIAKGYTKAEAEEKAQALRDGIAARQAARAKGKPAPKAAETPKK